MCSLPAILIYNADKYFFGGEESWNDSIYVDEVLFGPYWNK